MQDNLINKSWTRFNKGDEVLCVDDSSTYVEGAGQILRQGECYVVDRQSFAGYVWVKNVNSPFQPFRFKRV